jgi:ribonuclease P protein component
VVDINLHRVSCQGTNHEKDVSTKQHQAKTDARVLNTNGHTRRAQGIKAAKGQGPKEIDCCRTAKAGQDVKRRIVPERGLTFPKQARLRKRPEFLKLSRWGKKTHSPNFVIITRPNNQGGTRLGLTVSAKVGNAVVRNRLKRLLRECFRQNRHRITPTKDILIIAKKPAAELSFVEIESEFKKAVIDGDSR